MFRSRSLGTLIGLILLTGCSSTAKRPCTEGGQPAHDPLYGAPAFKGTKTCYQKPDGSGGWVNDGKYVEKYLSEKIAVIGEFKMGKKTGRWIEYDEKGKKTSDRYFNEGKEIPAP